MIPSVLRLLLPILQVIAIAQASEPESVRLQVPVIKQPYNQCMIACVSMVLSYYHFEAAPTEIKKGIPIYRDGTTGRDLLHYVESVGFRGFLVQPDFSDLFVHLKRGRPLIVLLPGRGSLNHAMVLLGCDESSLVLNDPASGKQISLPLQHFQREWEKCQRWTFLIVPR